MYYGQLENSQYKVGQLSKISSQCIQLWKFVRNIFSFGNLDRAYTVNTLHRVYLSRVANLVVFESSISRTAVYNH